MAPRIDVSETDTELKIEAELPGIDEKDVEVVLSDGRLTIKGEKKQEKEEKKKDYHMVERSYGSFARSIALPFEADPNRSRRPSPKACSPSPCPSRRRSRPRRRRSRSARA